mgnify:CR=1 FL=1
MATWAFSDIHGNYNLWKQIQEYCALDDTIIFLGDAIDRGKDGIKIMQEMFNDSRITYLIGNHEELFLDYIEDIPSALMTQKSVLTHNQSYQTLKDYEKLSLQEQDLLIYNLKVKTAYKTLYINKDNKKILLCHSGIDYNNILSDNKNLFIWDRSHMNTLKWQGPEDYYIIHGHTPIPALHPNRNKILTYCNSHKIDIDMGCFATHMTALINLDTFEVIYFKEQKEEING